ncbi:DUF2922 domain-containing protein [Clostridium sp.]|uniref:DUF2922 domain-containing protein n=1 Tax=Clostridium sp. TaxID=1506 RepID=UPI002FC68411
MDRKLVLTFIDQADAKFNFIINDVSQEQTGNQALTEAKIKAIMNAAITGSVLMSKAGLVKSIESAMVVDTTETKYELV